MAKFRKITQAEYDEAMTGAGGVRGYSRSVAPVSQWPKSLMQFYTKKPNYLLIYSTKRPGSPFNDIRFHQELIVIAPVEYLI